MKGSTKTDGFGLMLPPLSNFELFLIDTTPLELLLSWSIYVTSGSETIGIGAHLERLIRPKTAPYVSVPCIYMYVRPDQSLGGMLVLIKLLSR